MWEVGHNLANDSAAQFAVVVLIEHYIALSFYRVLEFKYPTFNISLATDMGQAPE